MRFMVSRTSDHRGNEQPCANAVRATYDVTEAWANSSTVAEAWFIEVASLDDLMRLADTFDVSTPLIIKRAMLNPGIREIEIYDDWRE